MAHRSGFKAWLQSLFKKCEHCGRWPARRIYCKTAYHDEALNLEPVLCVECEVEYDEYWNDMWREYYDSRL